MCTNCVDIYTWYISSTSTTIAVAAGILGDIGTRSVVQHHELHRMDVVVSGMVVLVEVEEGGDRFHLQPLLPKSSSVLLRCRISQLAAAKVLLVLVLHYLKEWYLLQFSAFLVVVDGRAEAQIALVHH